MEQKSNYRCVDGRNYDVTMSWNENFKDSDHVFKIGFQAMDTATHRAFALPREIATIQYGDPSENLGERVKYYYNNKRDVLMADYLTSAYRRATDWIERGK